MLIFFTSWLHSTCELLTAEAFETEAEVQRGRDVETVLPASRSWFESPASMPADVTPGTTQGDARSPVVASVPGPGQARPGRAFDEVRRRRISMRRVARLARTIRAPASAAPAFPSAAQTASQERSLWSKHSNRSQPLRATVLDYRSRPEKPRRVDATALFLSLPPSFSLSISLWSGNWPAESRRLRAVTIERHRCRIYETSYVFDKSTSVDLL